MTETGTFRKSAHVRINIEKLTNHIAQRITDFISDAVATQAETSSPADYEWNDADIFEVNVDYEGSYKTTRTNATREEPAYEDTEFKPETLDVDALKKYLSDRIPEHMKDLIEICSLSESDIELTPDEPDWDSMPGGHDDY